MSVDDRFLLPAKLKVEGDPISVPDFEKGYLTWEHLTAEKILEDLRASMDLRDHDAASLIERLQAENFAFRAKLKV